MSKTKKIVLTGPESTGKSSLINKLAEYFAMPCVPEIARNYVLNLKRQYNYQDVVKIAELQIEKESQMMNSGHAFVFFDTDLIITKIWMLHCFGKQPSWLDQAIISTAADLHLLCYYDLIWEPNPVRENPDIRPELFLKYKREIIRNGMNYRVVKGVNDTRFQNARKAVQDFFDI